MRYLRTSERILNSATRGTVEHIIKMLDVLPDFEVWWVLVGFLGAEVTVYTFRQYLCELIDHFNLIWRDVVLALREFNTHICCASAVCFDKKAQRSSETSSVIWSLSVRSHTHSLERDFSCTVLVCRCRIVFLNDQWRLAELFASHPTALCFGQNTEVLEISDVFPLWQ